MINKIIELEPGETVPTRVTLKGKQKGKDVNFVFRFWTKEIVD